MELVKKYYWGPVLVMFAAALWAFDGLLRTGLTADIPSVAIVFYEHLFGFVLLSPIFFSSLKTFRKLSSADWLRLIFLTIVSSVLGTLLFTEALGRSFASGDFATPILLQKLQPIFVIGLAAIFLKERITFRYIALVPIALIGSYMISFGVDPVALSLDGKELVYILSIGAALAWGSGTILSKSILQKLSFAQATAMRFFLAMPIGLIALLLLNKWFPPMDFSWEHIWRFIVIAFTTGAGAVLIYYRGLKETPARVATIAELTFPIVAILIAISSLNPYGEPQQFSLANGFGISLVLISMLLISFDQGIKKTEISTATSKTLFLPTLPTPLPPHTVEHSDTDVSGKRDIAPTSTGFLS